MQNEPNDANHFMFISYGLCFIVDFFTYIKYFSDICLVCASIDAIQQQYSLIKVQHPTLIYITPFEYTFHPAVQWSRNNAKFVNKCFNFSKY